MNWTMDKSRPICPQICERLSIMISSGELKPGERLMSVREVALNAGVNPNTVQKSFEQLEQKGIIYSRPGSGWYVGDDINIAQNLSLELIRSKTLRYLSDMHSLGMNNESIIKTIKEYCNE